MPRALCTLALLLCALLPVAAETVALDTMDADQGRWGPAAAETRLVKEGRAALRWQTAAGPLHRDDLRVDLATYRSLRLWVYSPLATFARIRFTFPVPGKDDVWVQFKVDWQGWNRMELYPELITTPPADPALWHSTRGLTIAETEAGFAPTELVLDGLEQSTDYPQIRLSEGETLIDWPYFSAHQIAFWKPTTETSQRPAGSYGLDRYWCWSYPWVVEDPARRDVVAYTRDFGTDLSGYDTLELRASNDTEGWLTVHLQVDGKWSTPLQYVKGTGAFQELQMPLPPGARRLEAVTVDLSEPPDQVGGPAGRQVKCNLHWLLLRRPGAPLGSPPRGMPKLEPAPLAGSLEDTGLAGGVYFGRDDLSAVRRLFKEGAARSLYDGTLKAADKYLETAPEPFAGDYAPEASWVGVRTSAKLFPLSAAAQTCGLAYVLTGEKKYADWTRRALLTLARCDKWSDGAFARFPQGWGGHGNTFTEGSMAYSAGLAYDWVRNALSPAERREVAAGILHHGVWWIYDLLKHNPGILKMNQGVVFDAELGCALIALEPDLPEVAALRKQSEEWIWTGLREYSLQDGESTEGIGYWHYTWSTAVKLLAALGRRDPEAMLRNCPPNARRAMDWIVHMKSNASPGWRGVFLCDGGGGLPSPAVCAFFARYLKDPTAASLQATYSDPGDPVAAFMWQHDTKPVPPPQVLARHFRGAGYVFLREGFDYGDTLFALLGQPPLAGHNQHDRTAFILEAFGEHLAMDPGMISYANPIHTSLARTRLHNALTIDGQDGALSSSVAAFFSSPLLDYSAVDGTAAYPQSRSYLRRALYLRPDHFVVFDDLQLRPGASGRIEWNLNSAGTLSLQGSRLTATTPRASLVADFVTPGGLRLEQEVWPCSAYGARQNNHGTISSAETKDTAEYAVSLYPVRPGQEGEVETTALAGTNCRGLRVRRGGVEERVLRRLAPGPLECQGLQADGELAVVRLSGGELVGAALIGGTALSWQGRALLSAGAVGNYSADYRDGWAVASAQAPPGTSLTVTPSAGEAYRGLHLGSVAGTFGEQSLPAAGFTLPAGEAPQGGYWLLLDRPAWLPLAGGEAGSLKQVLVDGQELPEAGLPEGAVPAKLELLLQPGSVPLDPRSLLVSCNGLALPPGAFTTADTQGRLHVSLAVPDLLPGRTLTKYTPLTLEVTCRDRGLWRQKTSARCRLVLRPKTNEDVVWLSTVKPVRHMVHGALGLDKDYLGQPISLGGNEYPRGLSTHPETAPQGGYAEVVFDLRPYAGKRSRFRALVGIPDGETGSCQFLVYTRQAGGDWVERAKTEVLTTANGPAELDVPLGDAEELRLYVNDGGNGIGSDHAMWAQARLE